MNINHVRLILLIGISLITQNSFGLDIDFIKSRIVNASYVALLYPSGSIDELEKKGSVYVNTESLLRPKDNFLYNVGEGMSVVEFAKHIFESHADSIGPNQLVIVVVRRDLIRRYYLRQGSAAADNDRYLKDFLMPGDVLLLGVR